MPLLYKVAVAGYATISHYFCFAEISEFSSYSSNGLSTSNSKFIGKPLLFFKGTLQSDFFPFFTAKFMT